MSAVSMLKRKARAAPVEKHLGSNEFAALEALDPDARPITTKTRKTEAGGDQHLNERKREDPISVVWIRDNIKVTQTSKGPQVVWTPWKNGSELALIRDWFFPQHAVKDPYSPPAEDFRGHAIQVVSQWEKRNKDLELPHSILATSSLTDAVLHDSQPCSERICHISDRALQSIYAMAFCRFVNGFVDRDVSKSSLTALSTTTGIENKGEGDLIAASRGEGSMYALASRIGLPQRFVDMRHQITHEKMPSIEELANLAKEALEWMYQRWWKMNAVYDPTEAWQRWREAESNSLLNGVLGNETDEIVANLGEEANIGVQKSSTQTRLVEENSINYNSCN